jgi:hypothetical protein
LPRPLIFPFYDIIDISDISDISNISNINNINDINDISNINDIISKKNMGFGVAPAGGRASAWGGFNRPETPRVRGGLRPYPLFCLFVISMISAISIISMIS